MRRFFLRYCLGAQRPQENFCLFRIAQAMVQTSPLHVKESIGKGFGVFSTRFIAAGEVFDEVPVLIIPVQEWEHIEKTILFNYCYGWGDDAAVALGVGSLYNHSFNSNAKYTKIYETKRICYTALRNIDPGEEITINYNGDVEDRSPMWFDVLP